LARNNEFQTISTAGVKGVKIDFWLSDKQKPSNIISTFSGTRQSFIF